MCLKTGMLLLSVLFVTGNAFAAVTASASAVNPEDFDLWHGKKERIYLNDNLWKLTLLPRTENNLTDDPGTVGRFYHVDYDDSSWKNYHVPGNWPVDFKSQSGKPFCGIGWYRRTLAIPDKYRDRRLFLCFNQVDAACEVWINGKKVGSYANWLAMKESQSNQFYYFRWDAGSFRLDITDAAVFGKENTIAIRVYAPERNSAPRMGGITQPVYIDVVPAIHAEKILVSPDVGTSSITLDCTVVNTTQQSEKISVALELASWTSHRYKAPGKAMEKVKPLGEIALKPGRNQCQFRVRLDAPVYWNLERPHLYHLTMKAEGGPFRDRMEVIGQARFGFRELTHAKSRFILNGRFISLRGDQPPPPLDVFEACNRDKYMERYLRRYQEQNINHIRTHSTHWPEPFYDLCDEMGLLTISELSPDIADKVIRDGNQVSPEIARSIALRVETGYNHPSLIAYSMGNERWDTPEKKYAPALNALYDTFKALDKTRYIISSSGRFCSDYGPLAKSDFDVLHNYTGLWLGDWLCFASPRTGVFLC